MSVLHDSVYPKTIVNEKILIYGPMPPPLGGIAVHIQRVSTLLKEHNEVIVFDATVFSRLARLPKLFIYLLKYRPTQVHYHTFYHHVLEWLFIFIARLVFRYEIYAIDHDCRDFYRRAWMTKFILGATISRIDHLILMGERVQQSYDENKINYRNFIIDTPFIAPNLNEEAAILAAYPEKLFIFLQQHHPIIVVNAFRLVLMHDKDLYGIDQSLLLMRALKKEFSKIGLIIALATRGNQDYFHTLQKIIRDYDLIDHVFWLEQQKELWPLFKQVNLFIRPTLSDNYGISVAEALWCGTPAIASDVCKRPEETVLYQTGNIADLIQKTRNVLQKQERYEATNHRHHHLHAQ